jgi:PII-like signaling protein
VTKEEWAAVCRHARRVHEYRSWDGQLRGSGVLRGGRGFGVQSPPDEIHKFWQSRAEFPVP